MPFELEGLLAPLRLAGWEVRLRSPSKAPTLGKQVAARFPHIPSDYLSFLTHVDYCCSADQKSWFLCNSDFRDASDAAFSWNEFEKTSWEAAREDRDWQDQIRKFWQRHLPIAMSVRGDYSYVALRFAETDGEPDVVYGFEPEYEEPLVVASSYRELATLIGEHTKGHPQSFLARFL